MLVLLLLAVHKDMFFLVFCQLFWLVRNDVKTIFNDYTLCSAFYNSTSSLHLLEYTNNSEICVDVDVANGFINFAIQFCLDWSSFFIRLTFLQFSNQQTQKLNESNENDKRKLDYGVGANQRLFACSFVGRHIGN